MRINKYGNLEPLVTPISQGQYFNSHLILKES